MVTASVSVNFDVWGIGFDAPDFEWFAVCELCLRVVFDGIVFDSRFFVDYLFEVPEWMTGVDGVLLV